MKIEIGGREVSRKSCEVCNVLSFDYPDFCDAYIEYAEFTDGTELNEDELEILNEENTVLINELAHQSCF